MARIVVISKYPPIEGGIAAKTYWFCKALAERGHEVHIVTDRLGAAPEYSHPMERGEPAMENVFVHRPQGDIPWHIPDDKHRVLDLLNMAIEITNDVHPDVIDTGYFVPYGIVGYLTSQATGVPFVLRHGGSDLTKFMEPGIWGALFKKTLVATSKVITDHDHAHLFNSYEVLLPPPYVPDPAFFNPKKRQQGDKPILAIIGKANYHWRHKGWHRVAKILSVLGSKFRYLIVSQGKGLSDFKKFMAESRVAEGVEWETFVSPWGMPNLLKRIDGLFVFDGDLPFPAFSNLVLECLYSGTAVITDGPHLLERYESEGLNVRDLPGMIFSVAGDEPNLAATQIIDYFEEQKTTRPLSSSPDQDYQRYIIANEDALRGPAVRSPTY